MVPTDSTISPSGVKTYTYDTTYYGSGATAVVDSVTPVGGIYSISIVDSGSGYSKAYPPTVKITAPSGPAGVNFSATVTVNSDNTISLGVKNQGSNYFSIYSKSIAKWRRDYFELNYPQNTAITSCNFPIVHYADVLLMAAEADLIVNGGTTTGLGYYNQVRRRAYGYSPISPSPYDAPSITIDSIKAERSRELCFEGVRRNDLKRWGLSNWQNTLNNIVSQLGIYNTTFPPASTFLSASQITITNFLSNPQKYSVFPKPASELALEQALYQNPGW